MWKQQERERERERERVVKGRRYSGFGMPKKGYMLLLGGRSGRRAAAAAAAGEREGKRVT